MISFDEYIFEAKLDKDVRVVVLSGRSHKNEDGMFVTARKIKDMCTKKGIKCYVAFAEDAFLKKDEKDNLRIHNVEDKTGFKINKNNTAFIIRNSVMRKKASVDLLSQIERHNMFCINNRESMEVCEDKYRTILRLSDSDIPVPLTSIATNEETIDIAVKKVGGKFPVVVKTITGSKGVGVFIIDRIESLKSSLQAIWKVNSDTEIILQEYIESAYDLRIHVLGKKVIAAMKRFKIKKDFRSNFSLGGKVSDVKLTEEQEKIALLAAKAVGAVWSGVDMMIDKDGKCYIIEVNTSPGTQGIEQATGKSIVEMVVKYALDKKHWNIQPMECGYIEMVDFELLGEIPVKMDTGNGSYCVIDANKWKIDGNIVKWKHGGQEFEHKLDSMKKVRVGGVKNEYEERPVILLDVRFNGNLYKDVKFTLSNREGMTTPVLMNRSFIKMANLSINPAKRYALTVKGGTKAKEETK